MAVNIKEICVLIIALCAVGNVAEQVQANGKNKTTTATTITTTPAAPTTTTVPITTTTDNVTTSTIAPTPKPNYWFVVNGSTVCILLNATINITINNHTQIVPMPINGSSANGTCGTVEETINIYFKNSESVLTLTFKEKTGGDTTHHVVSLVEYKEKDKVVVRAETPDFWVNSNGMISSKQYKCAETQQLYQNGSDSISVKDMQLEIFRNTNTTVFSTSSPITCPADSKVSNLVPIIVGAALGGLILIVLIAYLIGRKRSRHGYEQV